MYHVYLEGTKMNDMMQLGWSLEDLYVVIHNTTVSLGKLPVGIRMMLKCKIQQLPPRYMNIVLQQFDPFQL